jgi:hypothetical protein
MLAILEMLARVHTGRAASNDRVPDELWDQRNIFEVSKLRCDPRPVKEQ